MSDKLLCIYCKEETTTDSHSKKWNISKENEKPVCYECDMKFFEQENYHLYSEYGSEEIAEDNERIRCNNRDCYNSQHKRNENNYYEVETLPTLGLSLSLGGKRKIK